MPCSCRTLTGWQVGHNREGNSRVHQEWEKHTKQHIKDLKNTVRTHCDCTGHFSLFLTLCFSSPLCRLELCSSLRLADGPTAAQATIAHRLLVPHIFYTGPIWQQVNRLFINAKGTRHHHLWTTASSLACISSTQVYPINWELGAYCFMNVHLTAQVSTLLPMASLHYFLNNIGLSFTVTLCYSLVLYHQYLPFLQISEQPLDKCCFLA